MPCRGIGVDSNDIGTGIDIGFMNIPDQLRVCLKGHCAPGFVIHGCAKPFQFSANSTIENDWIGAIDQSVEFHELLYLFMSMICTNGRADCRLNPTASVIDLSCKLNDRISHNLDPRNQIVPVSILFECMADTADRRDKQHAGWHVVGEVHGVVQCT